MSYRVLFHVGPCFSGTPHMNQNPFRRWTIMITQPQPLIEVFAEIPDFRRPRGKHHPLPAILSRACCAMLCGYRSYSAIAKWGRNYGSRIAQALGFFHNTPVRRRCTQFFDTWTATPWKRHWSSFRKI